MVHLEPTLVEKEIITLVQELCSELKIDAVVDESFRPGIYIKSQVLMDIISSIEDSLEIVIPLNCYIFCSKERKQLSIEETVQKIIKVAEIHGQQHSNVGQGENSREA